MRYKVSGRFKRNNKSVVALFDASSESQASQFATEKGIVVESVEPDAPRVAGAHAQSPPSTSSRPSSGAGRNVDVREAVMVDDDDDDRDAAEESESINVLGDDLTASAALAAALDDAEPASAGPASAQAAGFGVAAGAGSGDAAAKPAKRRKGGGNAKLIVIGAVVALVLVAGAVGGYFMLSGSSKVSPALAFAQSYGPDSPMLIAHIDASGLLAGPLGRELPADGPQIAQDLKKAEHIFASAAGPDQWIVGLRGEGMSPVAELEGVYDVRQIVGVEAGTVPLLLPVQVAQAAPNFRLMAMHSAMISAGIADSQSGEKRKVDEAMIEALSAVGAMHVTLAVKPTPAMLERSGDPQAQQAAAQLRQYDVQVVALGLTVNDTVELKLISMHGSEAKAQEASKAIDGGLVMARNQLSSEAAPPSAREGLGLLEAITVSQSGSRVTIAARWPFATLKKMMQDNAGMLRLPVMGGGGSMPPMGPGPDDGDGMPMNGEGMPMDDGGSDDAGGGPGPFDQPDIGNPFGG